jgi:tetratricopeptide (TPR) repeat protein
MRAGVCLIALLLLGSPLGADDREIARSYFLSARGMYRSGNDAEAEDLLRQAVAFLPSYSDAGFLLGLILCRRQATTAEGVALIEKAVKLDSWTDTSPLEARAALAGLYLRTKRFRESLALYNSLRSDDVYSGEHARNRALAAYGAGDVKGAEEILRSALREFPEDRRIPLAYVKILLQRGLSAAARTIVERGRRQFPDEPGFLFYKIALDRDAASRKADFELYRRKGGRDPAVVLYLLGADNATFTAALDFFFNQKGDDSVLLIEALVQGLSRNKARRAEAIRRLGTLEGEKTVDADGDGYYEEKYLFKENEPVTAIIDKNQDGVPEADIELENNTPVSIKVVRPAGGTERLFYNGYPRLSRVVIETGTAADTYEIVPDALRFAPLTALPSPAAFKFRVGWPRSVTPPAAASLDRVSYSLTEDPADRRLPLRKWDLYAGRKTMLHEDTYRTGRFDRIVVYDAQGLPARGRIDIDGDGYYEITETYVGGVLTRIAYDENKDGRPDYWQNATGSVLEWDLNGDGKPDVIGRRRPDGTIVADYSGLLRRSK